MANKYIIEGATNNGDGTTSSAAASAGAAGAWNHINVFTGTAVGYGSLDDGDLVTFRSKTAAGVDITITSAVDISIGKSGLTNASQGVTWVLDDGTVWAGINGTLTIAVSANGKQISQLAYNNVIAAESKLILTSTYMSGNSNVPIFKTNEGTYIERPWIDLSAFTSGFANAIVMNGYGASVASLKITAGKFGSSGLIQTTSSQHYKIVSPNIELTLTNGTYPVFGNLSRNRVEVCGGRIFGSGATTGQRLTGTVTSSSKVKMVGFEFPKVMMPTLLSADPSGAIEDYAVEGFGIDGGNGAFSAQAWGYMSTRNDSGYPYLNSTGPDSASTPWSWQVYPVNASAVNTVEVPRIVEYTLTAAAKTITLEVLVANTMTDTKHNTWMEVAYLDDSGVSRFETTRVLGSTSALDVSSAGWSATTYGPVTFNKRNLSLTTAQNIAQDSVVQVTFKSTVKSASANDIVFVDGAPVFS